MHPANLFAPQGNSTLITEHLFPITQTLQTHLHTHTHARTHTHTHTHTYAHHTQTAGGVSHSFVQLLVV